MGGAITKKIRRSKNLECDVNTLKEKTLVDCKKILADNPGNRCYKFAIEYLNSDEGKALLYEGKQCIHYCILLSIKKIHAYNVSS